MNLTCGSKAGQGVISDTIIVPSDTEQITLPVSGVGLSNGVLFPISLRNLSQSELVNDGEPPNSIKQTGAYFANFLPIQTTITEYVGTYEYFSTSLRTKSLLNFVGENDCFVFEDNSVIVKSMSNESETYLFPSGTYGYVLW